MRLAHIHLPKPVSYAVALRHQEKLLQRQFDYKSALRNDPTTRDLVAPSPTLLTFQTEPTYTVGRRHLTNNPLSKTQIDFLTGAIAEPSLRDKVQHVGSGDQLATFYPSPRGGLLTYHAPGQLTAFMVLDLRAHRLSPRCYIRLLEDVVIATCARWSVPNTMTTSDPGVWIATTTLDGVRTPTDRKVCAVGVHVSRGITSHGLGFNILDQPINPANPAYSQSAPGYLSWGFGRIVACGLEGKEVTWLEKERPASSDDLSQPALSVHAVADTLATETAARLKVELIRKNSESMD